MVGLAQLVRASDCGPEGRRFNSDIPPHIVQISARRCFFDGIYREEGADFAGSTLFVFDVEVDAVWENHLLDGLLGSAIAAQDVNQAFFETSRAVETE